MEEEPTVRKPHSWYVGTVWLVWVSWRRLPYLRRYEAPRTWLFVLYDLLASRYVPGCDVFLGWSQVSLHSMRRAKRDGARVILEHPMAHVKTWMALMQEEYDRLGRMWKPYHSLFPRALVRRMLKEYEAADQINVLSEFAKNSFIQQGVPPEKITVTPLGVDTEVFRPRVEEEPDGVFRVLYVGRMELLKGVHYLLQAWAKLSLPRAELWLLGPLLPEIIAFFRRYDSSFRYFAPRERKEIVTIYQQASVFVLPSIQEGFGLVLLEAMACGLPVIATQNTGGPDVIRDGVDGFIVPIRDPETLKERLHWLYEHPDEARKMGKEARRRVATNFAWEQYGERLVQCLTNVMRGSCETE